jgi:topoisomerase IA-like protein
MRYEFKGFIFGIPVYIDHQAGAALINITGDKEQRIAFITPDTVARLLEEKLVLEQRIFEKGVNMKSTKTKKTTTKKPAKKTKAKK